MHPITGKLRRLLLYLAGWIPAGGLLFYLLTARGGLATRQAVGPAILLTVLYAFACLSAYYPCKATPIESSGIVRLALTHLVAAVVVSYCWLTAFRGVGYLISSPELYSAVSVRFREFYFILLQYGILLYLLSVAMHYALLAVDASRKALERELQARVLARDAELRALKAQINPHFLFNSLHSISALTSIDAKRAREMCITLADFLRMTLGLGEKSVIPLREELALVRSYLAVEKIRFGARLTLDEQVEDAALDFVVPPLLLQPLVENAVGHGIANLPEGGWIRMIIRRAENDGMLQIQVANNFDPEAPSRRRNGVGLKNVRQRLNARFGQKSQMSVAKDDSTFHVIMAFPGEKELKP
jgi:sensor histidine kinase YesM